MRAPGPPDGALRWLALVSDLQKRNESLNGTARRVAIGVAPESMRELFTAGYTTKESGTGLGLHSAASEGVGGGTTMRVRLRLPQEAGRPGRPVRG